MSETQTETIAIDLFPPNGDPVGFKAAQERMTEMDYECFMALQELMRHQHVIKRALHDEGLAGDFFGDGALYDIPSILKRRNQACEEMMGCLTGSQS